MANEWDRLSRQVIRQSRSLAQGNILGAGSAASPVQNITETLTDEEGFPLRLWVPGTDPWGARGFYFGSREPAREELEKS